MKKLICSCLLLISWHAFAARYTHTSPKFSVDYDEKAWEVVPHTKARPAREEVDKKMAGATLVVIQRKEADEKYHSRFSAVVDEKYKGKGTPAKSELQLYVKEASDFLKEQGFDVEDPKPYKLPSVDLPAMELKGSQRHLGLTFLQVVVVKNGQAFLLTSAARIKKFDGQAKDLRSMIDSFRF
jgi:hypothetical protein